MYLIAAVFTILLAIIVLNYFIYKEYGTYKKYKHGYGKHHAPKHDTKNYYLISTSSDELNKTLRRH
jgi:hypothetical protein